MVHKLGMSGKESFHEDYGRASEVKSGSELAFGMVFFVVLSLIGLWPLLDGEMPRWWLLAIAVVILVLALVRPAVLRPLNQLWHRFGLLLHRIVSPLVLGLLFFLTVTPTGLLMRLMGKDPLRLKFDPEAESYWIKREPPGPDPQTMTKQF